MNHCAPATMAELHKALGLMSEDSKIISGGTDLIIRMRMGLSPDMLLYPGRIGELSRIEVEGESVSIGAMATMTAIADFPFPRQLAALSDAAIDVGSRQIRNSGTIGGNTGNASAAGDLIPVLFLLHSEAEIAGPGGAVRRIPMQELVVGPMRTTLAYNEIITRFIVPIPQPEGDRTRKSAFVKLGSRKTLTISRIGLGVSLTLDGEDVITSAEVVAGAISLTPVHVEAAEEWLPGKKPDDEATRYVGQALSDLIRKITPEKFDRDYKVGAAFGVAEDVLARLACR